MAESIVLRRQYASDLLINLAQILCIFWQNQLANMNKFLRIRFVDIMLNFNSTKYTARSYIL